MIQWGLVSYYISYDDHSKLPPSSLTLTILVQE